MRNWTVTIIGRRAGSFLTTEEAYSIDASCKEEAIAKARSLTRVRCQAGYAAVSFRAR